MTELESQILETWQIHQRSTIFLIENISDEALKATLSSRGGRDVARQLAHMHNVRVWRLEAFAKKIAARLAEFDKGRSPSKKKLLEAYAKSGEVMEKFIRQAIENGGAISNFKRGVAPMIGYYISHEAHHRGHILLTMKQSGHKLPDALKWNIWEWNKI
jgi:uncharacterized damage-inducible protein DinB